MREMARAYNMKVEAWLTDEEAAIVRRHMADAYFTTHASYTRACVLAGPQVLGLNVDARLGELGLMINALTLAMPYPENESVKKLVPPLRKLIRQMQTDRAMICRNWEGGRR